MTDKTAEIMEKVKEAQELEREMLQYKADFFEVRDELEEIIGDDTVTSVLISNKQLNVTSMVHIDVNQLYPERDLLDTFLKLRELNLRELVIDITSFYPYDKNLEFSTYLLDIITNATETGYSIVNFNDVFIKLELRN